MSRYLGSPSISWAYICKDCGCIIYVDYLEKHDQFHSIKNVKQ